MLRAVGQLCLFALLLGSARASVFSVTNLATVITETSSTLAPTPAAGASGASAATTPELAIGADVLSKSFGVAVAAWCGCCLTLTVLLQCVATLLDGQASSAGDGGKQGGVEARGRKKLVDRQGGATPGGDCAQACKQSCKPFVRRWYPCWYECCCRRAAAPAGPDYAPVRRTARNGGGDAKGASSPPASYAAAQRRARPNLDDASTVFSYEDRNDFDDDAASQGGGGRGSGHYGSGGGFGESYEPA